MNHPHLTRGLSLAIGFVFHLSAHASPDAAVAAAASGTGLSLGAPFVDHAVLQQGIGLPVWGTAPAGTAVTVEFTGQTRKAVADGGNQWRIRLDPLVAEPLASVHEPLARKSLHVHAEIDGKTESLEVKDLLVGEVWLCSGRSSATLQQGRAPRLTVQHIRLLIRFS